MTRRFYSNIYRTAGSSFQMHSQFQHLFLLYDKTFFTEFQSLVFCYYWLSILRVVKNLNNATTNLHFKKKKEWKQE